MDKIEKALKKLTVKEKEQVRRLLKRLKAGKLAGLDIKKLKGRSDIYRVRKGKLRLIYRLDKDRKIFILAIERRTDTTHK
jgi:mRNA-degrading endonuclease RelE of RelBE toxin-antitoxin system